MNYSAQDIFKIVGMFVMWGLAILVGITVFTTVAEIMIAFVSTGIGALILAVAALVWWRKHKSE